MTKLCVAVLAAPGFMCSSVPAPASLPLVRQAALAAPHRPQVKASTAFSCFVLLRQLPFTSAAEIDGNCFVILPAKQVEERDGRFLKIPSCSSSAIHTHFINYIKLVHKTSRIFSKYNWSYPAFFLFVPCFCRCN